MGDDILLPDMLLLDMLMLPMGDIELDIVELAAMDDEADADVIAFDILCFILGMVELLLDMLDMDMPLPMADWACVSAGMAAAPVARTTAAAIGRKARMVCFLCRVTEGIGGTLTAHVAQAGTHRDYVVARARVSPPM